MVDWAQNGGISLAETGEGLLYVFEESAGGFVNERVVQSRFPFDIRKGCIAR